MAPLSAPFVTRQRRRKTLCFYTPLRFNFYIRGLLCIVALDSDSFRFRKNTARAYCYRGEIVDRIKELVYCCPGHFGAALFDNKANPYVQFLV